MTLQIGYNDRDQKYFVYESEGLRPIVFRGSYTQCLIILGGNSLGKNLEESIKIANQIVE